jgi:2-iminobutanoate/2-iminopropanoate deaminase
MLFGEAMSLLLTHLHMGERIRRKQLARSPIVLAHALRRMVFHTMKQKAVKHPDKSTNTGAYSAGVCCDGWLYVSGHASQDLKTGDVISGTTAEETTRTLASIGKVLNEADCTFDDVVKCTCYLAKIEDFDEFNQAYSAFFSGVMPARTTVQAVLWGGLKVEIDAIARLNGEEK